MVKCWQLKWHVLLLQIVKGVLALFFIISSRLVELNFSVSLGVICDITQRQSHSIIPGGSL